MTSSAEYSTDAMLRKRIRNIFYLRKEREHTLHQEFKKALVRGTDLDGVKSELIAAARRENDRILKRIERDAITAKLVRAGLNEKPTSEAYKVSRAFLDDCNRACGQAEREADEEILQYLKADDLKIGDDEGGQTDDGTADSAEPSEKDD